MHLFLLFDSWRYDDLGDLSHVTTKDVFKKANTGLAHTYQIINVEDFEVRNDNLDCDLIVSNEKACLIMMCV